MLRVLRHARIPLFMHRKSNHIFTVWQHMVLLVTDVCTWSLARSILLKHRLDNFYYYSPPLELNVLNLV